MVKTSEEMKITAMIQNWLDEAGWKDDIEIDSEARTARVITLYELDGHIYRLFIEADEGRHRLAVYMYGSIGIPAARYAEACKLANRINCTMGIGRIAAISDGNFQYKALVDIEGGSPATTMIDNMFEGGTTVFKDWSNEMGQLIFSGKSADQIFEEFEKAHRQSEAGSDVLICPGSLVPS